MMGLLLIVFLLRMEVHLKTKVLSSIKSHYNVSYGVDPQQTK